jgi:hypothetical protein
VAPFLLIFLAIPYLFDLAYCEELYSTPLSQASLIDGEKVEPSGEESSSPSFDSALEESAKVSTTSSSFAPALFFEGCSFRSGFSIVLTSRPPPAA